MITLESWVMIKHLHKDGVPKSRIAEELGLDRRTVDKAINEDKPPQHERQSGNFIASSNHELLRLKNMNN